MMKSKLPHSIDARDWVKEWLETIKKDPSIPTDEGTMLAWFANAIMAGWDEHKRRSPDKPSVPAADVEKWCADIRKRILDDFMPDPTFQKFPQVGMKLTDLVNTIVQSAERALLKRDGDQK